MVKVSDVKGDGILTRPSILRLTLNLFLNYRNILFGTLEFFSDIDRLAAHDEAVLRQLASTLIPPTINLISNSNIDFPVVIETALASMSSSAIRQTGTKQ